MSTTPSSPDAEGVGSLLKQPQQQQSPQQSLSSSPPPPPATPTSASNSNTKTATVVMKKRRFPTTTVAPLLAIMVLMGVLFSITLTASTAAAPYGTGGGGGIGATGGASPFARLQEDSHHSLLNSDGAAASSSSATTTTTADDINPHRSQTQKVSLVPSFFSRILQKIGFRIPFSHRTHTILGADHHDPDTLVPSSIDINRPLFPPLMDVDAIGIAKKEKEAELKMVNASSPRIPTTTPATTPTLHPFRAAEVQKMKEVGAVEIAAKVAYNRVEPRWDNNQLPFGRRHLPPPPAHKDDLTMDLVNRHRLYKDKVIKVQPILSAHSASGSFSTKNNKNNNNNKRNNSASLSPSISSVSVWTPHNVDAPYDWNDGHMLAEEEHRVGGGKIQLAVVNETAEIKKWFPYAGYPFFLTNWVRTPTPEKPNRQAFRKDIRLHFGVLTIARFVNTRLLPMLNTSLLHATSVDVFIRKTNVSYAVADYIRASVRQFHPHWRGIRVVELYGPEKSDKFIEHQNAWQNLEIMRFWRAEAELSTISSIGAKIDPTRDREWYCIVDDDGYVLLDNAKAALWDLEQYEIGEWRAIRIKEAGLLAAKHIAHRKTQMDRQAAAERQFAEDEASVRKSLTDGGPPRGGGGPPSAAANNNNNTIASLNSRLAEILVRRSAFAKMISDYRHRAEAEDIAIAERHQQLLLEANPKHSRVSAPPLLTGIVYSLGIAGTEFANGGPGYFFNQAALMGVTPSHYEHCLKKYKWPAGDANGGVCLASAGARVVNMMHTTNHGIDDAMSSNHSTRSPFPVGFHYIYGGMRALHILRTLGAWRRERGELVHWDDITINFSRGKPHLHREDFYQITTTAPPAVTKAAAPVANKAKANTTKVAPPPPLSASAASPKSNSAPPSSPKSQSK